MAPAGGHAPRMTAPESPRPPQRLAARVVPYWIIGDGATSIVLTGLAWFVGRPWLADNWESWSTTLEYVLLGICLAALSMALLIPPMNYARWRYGFVGDRRLMVVGGGCSVRSWRVSAYACVRVLTCVHEQACA